MTCSATSPVTKDVTTDRTSFDSPVISLSSATSRNFLYVYFMVHSSLLLVALPRQNPRLSHWILTGGRNPPVLVTRFVEELGDGVCVKHTIDIDVSTELAQLFDGQFHAAKSGGNVQIQHGYACGVDRKVKWENANDMTSGHVGNSDVGKHNNITGNNAAFYKVGDEVRMARYYDNGRSRSRDGRSRSRDGYEFVAFVAACFGVSTVIFAAVTDTNGHVSSPSSRTGRGCLSPDLPTKCPGKQRV